MFGNSSGLLLVLGSLALSMAVTFAVLTIVAMILAATAVQLSVRRIRSRWWRETKGRAVRALTS